MKIKELSVLARMQHIIENSLLNECDPDVADLMIEAQAIIESHTEVDNDSATAVDDESMEEWLEGVRVANINPLAPS